MGVDAAAFLERWHDIVARRDLDGLGGVLADDIALGAPPYWSPLEGRELVSQLLGLIVNTIEGFRYRREWISGSELALEFTGRVGDLDLQGIDLISLDASGRIRRFEVPMRPLNAVLALRESIAPQMAAFLSQRAKRAG
jgi:hypothetical protein